jgi:SAM-dependent methyltransferase
MELVREWGECAAAAPGKERDTADAAVCRALCWREIERHLDGVKTILDVGAGAGEFSIPLARRGYQVIHFESSAECNAIARQAAQGAPSIDFIEGDATDLYRFPNRSFDLVLNINGAISLAGARAEQALRESCRVTGGTLIVTVSNRAQLVTVSASSSLEQTGQIASPVYVIFDRGEWQQDDSPPDSPRWRSSAGPLKAFLGAELRAILHDADLQVMRVGGIGSLVSLCTVEAIQRACENETVFGEFVTLCDRFDLEILPDGPGARRRPGLIGVAARY